MHLRLGWGVASRTHVTRWCPPRQLASAGTRAGPRRKVARQWTTPPARLHGPPPAAAGKTRPLPPPRVHHRTTPAAAGNRLTFATSFSDARTTFHAMSATSASRFGCPGSPSERGAGGAGEQGGGGDRVAQVGGGAVPGVEGGGRLAGEAGHSFRAGAADRVVGVKALVDAGRSNVDARTTASSCAPACGARRQMITRHGLSSRRLVSSTTDRCTRSASAARR